MVQTLQKLGSLWAMFSIIVDLPPYLRIKFQNIITHYLIGSPNPNINKFNKTYLQSLKELTLHGIQTLNQTFKIEVIGLSFMFIKKLKNIYY